MTRPTVAVATHVFDQPVRRSLRLARDIGADAVQLDVRREMKPAEFSETGRRQLRHELQELDLRIASLAYPTRRSLYDAEELEARLAGIKQALEFAYQLNVPVVTVRVGRLPGELSSGEGQVLLGVLNELARHSNRVGATLAITPTGESPERLVQLIEGATEGPLGVNFDPSVYVLAGRAAAESFRPLNELVTHVTVRDAVRDVDGSGLEVPVGRGEVEWDEFLAVLAEAEYRGPLTVDRTTGDDRPGDAARAIEFLRRVAMV